MLWFFEGIALKFLQINEGSAALVRRHRGTKNKAVDDLNTLHFHKHRSWSPLQSRCSAQMLYPRTVNTPGSFSQVNRGSRASRCVRETGPRVLIPCSGYTARALFPAPRIAGDVLPWR